MNKEFESNGQSTILFDRKDALEFYKRRSRELEERVIASEFKLRILRSIADHAVNALDMAVHSKSALSFEICRELHRKFVEFLRVK